MDRKQIVKVNVGMMISIVLVFVLTTLPWFKITFRTAEILDSRASSTLYFSIASDLVHMSEIVSVFGMEEEKESYISRLQALEYLDTFTTDEYIADDAKGIVDAAGVLLNASIAVTALFLCGLLIYYPKRWDKSVFICPYPLLIHCIWILLAPVSINLIYQYTTYVSVGNVVSIGLTPFSIAAICISVLASIVYFFAKLMIKLMAK